MENLILSRVILFALVFVHVLIGYASKIDLHINAKVLDTVFAVEILALTAYIIYDNILYPPHNGWVLAIIGYLFVYGVIFMTWVVYGLKTILPNKHYQLKSITPSQITLKHPIPAQKKGALGTIKEGWRSFEVCVISDDAFQKAKEGKPMTVKLKSTKQEDVPFPCFAVMEDVTSAPS